MKYLLMFLAALFLTGFDDPRTALPQVSAEDYKQDGLLGDKPYYSQASLELINYSRSLFETALSYRYPMNILFFPEATMDAEDAFAFIGEEVRKLQIDNLTAGDWATSPPDTLEEAVNRMSALLKSLNGNVAIP